ncbi:MAG: glycosyltransferase family 4 protein [Flavobacteriales bacterium]|nr:glycosyltransferase family 4 protein [Flavobacteriales bacterium]
MKIIQAHNFYQLSGGEDTVVAGERALLEEKGHQVIPYYKHNNLLKGSFKEKLKLINSTSWSKATFNEMDALLKEYKPDVCHVHNFLPLISPSIYDACIKNDVPVVQTLHNYRLICANGLFSREGKVCEDCLTQSPMGSVMKKCYRNSALQTYIVANMLLQHNKKGTWSNKVDKFICVTEFAKNKFIQHGIPESKLSVKPNFVSTRLVKEKKEDYLVYVGRLEKEKGVDLIMKIAASVSIKIKMLGEGVLASELSRISNVELIGQKAHAETVDYIANAKALLFPSILYEGMPMTILEAFSVNTPVIATDIGAMKSMIEHQRTGLLFPLNSQNAFLEAIKFILENENKMKEISNFAYEEFKLKYSKESNYRMLNLLYQEVCK